MCKGNRDFFFLLLFFLLLSSVAGALRAQEQPTPGKTQPLSPNNAQQSNSSDEHSKTWEELSRKFEQTLDQHDQTLLELSTKLLTSERNGEKLIDLYNELLKQSADLKNYNSQIAERMQERDEDLAYAYDRIDVLEKRFLKAVIAIIVLGAFIAVAVTVKVCGIFKVLPF